MKKNKYYKLLSGLLDNELSTKERLKAIKLLEKNSWFKEQYQKLKELKEITNSTKSNSLLSPNFTNDLKNKIYDYQNKENWFSRLVDRGFFTKLSYAMVSASAMFIIFLGVKLYFYEYNEKDIASKNTDSIKESPVVLGNNFSKAKSTIGGYSTVSPLNQGASSHANSITVLVKGSNITLYRGNEFIKVNIDTGQLVSKVDEKKKEMFKVFFNNNNSLKNIWLFPMKRFKKSIEQSNKK